MTRKRTDAEMKRMLALAHRIGKEFEGVNLLDVVPTAALIAVFAIIEQFDNHEARVRAVEAMHVHMLQMIEDSK